MVQEKAVYEERFKDMLAFAIIYLEPFISLTFFGCTSKARYRVLLGYNSIMLLVHFFECSSTPSYNAG
jgi:hypothetical protein